MSDQRIIFVMFAGREENMVLQRPYIDRLLETYPRAEYHLWNLTRNDADNAYVRGLHDPDARVLVFNHLWPGDNDWPIGCRKRIKRARWCGCKDCRPAPYSDVYRWYAEQAERRTEHTLAGAVIAYDTSPYDDAVFVKFDDDIVFLETERFGEVLAILAEHPSAVVSANVVNNVVCAKHDHELRQIMEEAFSPRTQREWFDLHASAEFAREAHDWFLADWQALTRSTRLPETARSLPGERVSINTIAFTYPTLLRLDATIQHPRFARMGDEGAICNNFLPRIAVTFRTAHLYFGPQRVKMTDAELDAYRERYAAVAREYLGES